MNKQLKLVSENDTYKQGIIMNKDLTVLFLCCNLFTLITMVVLLLK